MGHYLDPCWGKATSFIGIGTPGVRDTSVLQNAVAHQYKFREDSRWWLWLVVTSRSALAENIRAEGDRRPLQVQDGEQYALLPS